MSASRGLILDANIPIRAVFGVRVREILEKYEDEAKFYTPWRERRPAHCALAP